MTHYRELRLLDTGHERRLCRATSSLRSRPDV